MQSADRLWKLQGLKPNHNITLAFWLNLIFALIELVGAFFTNSVAIASDAIHDLGDSFALGVSWYLEKYSTKGRDHKFSFGYKRFSLLAALINCVVLMVGSLFVIREALPRLFHPQIVHADGMIGLALVGIAFNGFAAFKLHHGHSHNENILSLHFLEDVLGWVAVLIVAFAMKLGDYAFLDPLLSLAIAVFIIWNAGKRLRVTLRIFLQSIPDDLDLAVIEKIILEQAGVMGVHDTHAWSLDGQHHVLSAHVFVSPGLLPEQTNLLKNQLKKELCVLGIQHVTLELECEGDTCCSG